MDKKQIGEIIAAARKAQGVSQVQFAKNTAIRRQSLIEIESGQANVTIDRLVEVLDYLGLKLIILNKDDGPGGFIFRDVKPLLKDPDAIANPKKSSNFAKSK